MPPVVPIDRIPQRPQAMLHFARGTVINSVSLVGSSVTATQARPTSALWWASLPAPRGFPCRSANRPLLAPARGPRARPLTVSTRSQSAAALSRARRDMAPV